MCVGSDRADGRGTDGSVDDGLTIQLHLVGRKKRKVGAGRGVDVDTSKDRERSAYDKN